MEGHAGLAQDCADGGARAASENRERLLLGRDQAQLDLGTIVRGALGRRHQGQVVQRQRPARPGRLDECHLLDPALAQLVEQQPVVGSVATAAVGEDSLGVPLALRTRAQGEHKHVVTERLHDLCTTRCCACTTRSSVPRCQ